MFDTVFSGLFRQRRVKQYMQCHIWKAIWIQWWTFHWNYEAAKQKVGFVFIYWFCSVPD